jgi:ABC-2 type transport system ATP-binding protein
VGFGTLRGVNAPAIEAVGLRKVFHTTSRGAGLVGGLRSLVAPKRVTKVAVDEVSFTVAGGELLALLGPNGAGKSTTIKMLSGVLVPSGGQARVAGHVPHLDRQANARRIGAVFGQRTQLWWDLPAIESFEMLRDIFKVGEAAYRRRLDELEGLLELSGFWRQRPTQMSLGQRVRCDLAAALLHDPPIIFLDEPTIGMDAVVKEQVREFIRYQVAERDRTIILTTHDMAEVSRLASRVVLINEGRVVYDGGLSDLQKEYGSGWKVRVTLARGAVPPSLPGLVETLGDEHLYAGVDPAEQRRLLRELLDRDDVEDLQAHGDDLEDIMAAVYRKRAAAAR